MRRAIERFAVVIAVSACGAASCSTPEPPPSTYLSRDALLDPTTCQGCHADHFRDWSGSMHAYASDDPVFLAMNRRGQRETSGALGTFCVNCHAPMAVREGATTDGQNLADLPPKLKGITCYFCHDVSDVTGTHDNPLVLANDITMRGPIADPLANATHPAAYSSFYDRDKSDSPRLCGACHDIVNGHGFALERTYKEWQASVFSSSAGATCGQCHMDQSPELVAVAQVPGAPLRRYHLHANPGADLAMTPFPQADDQKTKVQAFLDTTLQSALCVGDGTAGIAVIVDNVAAGHSWPSGAGQDRRAWAEVIAYASGTPIYQSGVVAAGQDVIKTADPDLWLLRDCIFDGAGAPVPMFWQAEKGESYLLPAQATFDPTDPRFYQTHVMQTFPRSTTLSQAPDRVTMRIRLQPMGFDVLDDLVKSGDLDVAVRNAMPVHDIGTAPLVEWTAATAKLGFTQGPIKFTCVTNTNMNYQAQTVPAPKHGACAP